MKKDLEHSIRDAFENKELEQAPQSIWSAIGDELGQHEVDTAVKESFEAQLDVAPEMVWERVQDQLDIDRVWTRIANKIKIRKYSYVLRVACLLVLLILPFSLDYDSVLYENVNVEAALSLDSTDTMSESVAKPSNEEFAVSTVASQPSSLLKSATIQADSVMIPTLVTQIVEPKRPKPRTAEDIIVGDLTTQSLSIESPDRQIMTQAFTQRKMRRPIGLTLGGVYSLSSTWIVDNETRIGFESESLVQNELSLGGSFGVFAEYHLNRRYSLTGEFLFQSQTKQNAHIYDTEGHYTLKEREINSYKISLLATRYTEPKVGAVSHSTLFRFGGYLSGVKSDFTWQDGVVTNINSVYNRYDLGLRAELGKRIYLKSFIVEGGLKGEFGLLNLASFESNIPPQLNFTRLVTGGAYVRIGYTF